MNQPRCSLSRSRRLRATLLLAGLGLLAFTRYPGLPSWPRNGAGQNYVVNLHPSRFPVSGEWDNNAQWACLDWRDLGATSFVPGLTRIAADYRNHADGVNTWDFANNGDDGVLATTFVRWTGNTMVDCDIVFNSFYAWTTRLQDPNESHPDSPYDFRAVARHECGHALGLDHENALLDVMNANYTIGAGIPHRFDGLGTLPHADDKLGCRIVYPPGVPTQVVNLMCTSWREPAAASGQARKLKLAQTSYAAGATIQVPLVVENQSNVQIAGGSFGVRLGLYLSTDKTISTADTQFYSTSFASSFGPHAVGYYEPTGILPASTPVGQYYVGAIIDYGDLIAESHEVDNFAWYGPITITNKPDLVIDSIVPATPTPERGTVVNLRLNERNAGFAPAPASVSHITLLEKPGAPSASDFLLGVASIPAIPAQGTAFVDFPARLPADLCGSYAFTVHALVDSLFAIDELDENNNVQMVPLTPQWPQAAGFYVGARRESAPSYMPLTLTICSKAQNVTLTPTTWYLLFWTCSGTSPGIQLPVGVLPLNYDVCTEIGTALEGTRLFGSRGVQGASAQGELMAVMAGAWLAPLHGYLTHWAAVYVDLASSSLVGVSRNAARMYVN